MLEEHDLKHTHDLVSLVVKLSRRQLVSLAPTTKVHNP